MRRYIYLLLLLLLACIDPYEVDVEEGPQLLTVEGFLTTEEGPHVIKLSRSATYGSAFEGLVRPVREATVIIRDNLGNVTFLAEDLDNRGSYFTPEGYRAVVGRSYTLQIQLNEGQVYTSLPERIESVPEIKSLDYQIVRIPVEGETNERSGVQLIADLDDPADQDNFYFWRTGTSTFILKTRPDLFTERPSDLEPNRDPDPKDCCDTCFQTETFGNTGIFIANDDSFNGLNTKLPVGFIEDDGIRFVETHRAEISQISVSAEAYRFLRLVKQQTEVSGSVFDPPPANIRGNMISLDNPEEVVLGYFMAGAEAKQEIYINAVDMDFRQPVTIIPDDCRVLPNTTREVPPNWNPN
ncbi:DUF4249 domain-containing protein [Algoriphagus sediminis]|uniref:DUF4249 domain-containing protein n=1 Tax=Algoriphagus sediminis TaxID=3057113 RepID=A0ABT7YEL1_9BACT|nr:DUF4249 domain-containing protein [Algoriphagus sediminis]MDN3204943.1 DUF4249 domain-containing protein [Algoriphagus sediminis]